MRDLHRAIAECLKALETAFADCEKPATGLQLVSVGGLGGIDAMNDWKDLRREDIGAIEEFGAQLGEDLDYMSSGAIRYFLPAILSLCLQTPGKIDESGFSFLINRMEAMWVREPDYKYYRGSRLDRAQIHAVDLWCGLMAGEAYPLGRDEYGLWPKEVFLKRIMEIRRCLPGAEDRADFDEEHQVELARTRRKVSPDPERRRTGWQKFKPGKKRKSQE
jgi:hypothetical protein